MKVFDFSSGAKGELLDVVARARAIGGWLVRKDDKVFKVELAKPRAGWAWHSSATVPVYENEKFVREEDLAPEQFGVGAICFSTGQDRSSQIWNWYVIGTKEWNREACQKGILKSSFHGMSTIKDRVESVAGNALYLVDKEQPAYIELASKNAEIDPSLVWALLSNEKWVSDYRKNYC